jgi:deaminated glutathione amidase
VSTQPTDAKQSTPFTAAMISMRTGLSPQASFDQAASLIRKAKSDGADYALTPEMSNLMQENRASLFALLQDEANDVSLAGYRELARDLKIIVHVGSLAVKASPERAANRSFVIDATGEIIARYDKIHMFDVDLGNGETYHESANYQPGEAAIVADLPWGRLGLTICYDLRFPALYRALAETGASFITVPAAFTKKTGEAHWHTLLRARAIETGCFVFAAAQGGKHENGRETFGHSLVIDPWGTILAEGGTEPGVILARVDPAKVATVRQSIPSLQNGRRFGVVDPNGGPDYLQLVRSKA